MATASRQATLQPPSSSRVSQSGAKSAAAPHPNPFTNLQRAVGNQGMLRLLRPSDSSRSASLPPTAPSILQTKLTINQPGDIYEQEADRVADQIIRADPVSAPSNAANIGPSTSLQRSCACGGTCDDCKKKKKDEDQDPHHLHRKTVPNITQHTGKTTPGGATEAPASVHQVLRSPGHPLDTSTRDFMESRLGQDFSDVRVHTGSLASKSAREVGALAYASGNHIAFRDGKYSPGDNDGRRLLAHELVHTIQQPSASGTIHRQLAPEASSDSDPARRISTLTFLYGIYMNRLGYIEKQGEGNVMALINPNRHHFVEITWDPTAPKLQSFIVIDDETWSISNWNFATNRFDTQESHVRQEVVEVKLSFWERLGNAAKFSARIVEGAGACVVGTGETIGFGAYAACAYGADTMAAGYRELQGEDPRTLANQAVAKGLSQFLSPELAQKVANYAEIAANAGMLAHHVASTRAATLGIPKEVPKAPRSPAPLELKAGDAEAVAARGEAKPAGPASTTAATRTTEVPTPPKPAPALEVKSGGGQGSKIPTGKLHDADVPATSTAGKGVKVDASHPIFKNRAPANDPPLPPQSQVAKVAAGATQDVRSAELVDHPPGGSDPGPQADPTHMGKKPTGSTPKKGSGPPAAELDPGEGDPTRKARKNRDDPYDLPRKEKISDRYNKPELEQSPELIERLPKPEHRRLYMEWLEKGHQGSGHPHVNPATDLDGSLQQFSEETGIPLRRKR